MDKTPLKNSKTESFFSADKQPVLGLDIGQKRLGIAIYLPEKATILPLKTLDRAGKRAEHGVLQLIEERKIGLIVAGIPLDLNDQLTTQVEDIKSFLLRIAKRSNVPQQLCDEFFSSHEAKELLGITGTPHRELRESGIIDSAAASIILQRFFANQNLYPTIRINELKKRAQSFR